MFSSLFRSPFELKLNDEVLRFDSEADFAFAIEGRTDVGGEESAVLMAMPGGDLHAEVAKLEAEEVSLRGHFEDAFASPSLLDERLAQVDPLLWRKEHQWDELMCALTLATTPAHAIKRSAVMTYLSYLAARRSVATDIARRRDEHAPDSRPGDDVKTAVSVAGTQENPGEESLPRGQATVVLDVDQSSVLLRFSQHRHRLVRTPSAGLLKDERVELVDDGGKRWIVPAGMSCVGRDRSCDIALRPLLKDISRAHAMMNLDESGRVWITDTSSQGTFIITEDEPESGV